MYVLDTNTLIYFFKDQVTCILRYQLIRKLGNWLLCQIVESVQIVETVEVVETVEIVKSLIG